ncbi:MAG: GNAT family N-acetyltransferase [Bacteroidales bacterium]|nr:GNAT family N-acetyltransferase [Bacteroidales bacterium]
MQYTHFIFNSKTILKTSLITDNPFRLILIKRNVFPRNSEDSLRKQIAAPGKAFHIAYCGNIPAGYVSFEADGKTADGRGRFHLQKLYALPEYQHSGLGRQMFEYVKALLHKWNPDGCRIELNVNRENPAVGFHEHIGMIRDRQGDFPIGKGFYMNDYIYVLDF